MKRGLLWFFGVYAVGKAVVESAADPDLVDRFLGACGGAWSAENPEEALIWADEHLRGSRLFYQRQRLLKAASR